jgi:cyclic pyranopterin monophosphate synthase
MKRLSHYDKRGRARMVDVSAKPVTQRTARAHAFVRISSTALRKLRRMESPKGDPLEIARFAGIAAAKRTAELIPLCHTLPLAHADVQAEIRKGGVKIGTVVTATAQTGVEMEALAAAAVAALTIYDMCKALDRRMEITELYLEEKIGGRSGHFRRSAKTG